MEVSKVDQELVAMAPDLSTGLWRWYEQGGESEGEGRLAGRS